MNPSKVAATVVTAALIALPVLAQPFQNKGEAGGWNVFFNEATGGCFVERQSDDGVVMQMGTQADMLGVDDTNYGFLAVYIPIPTDMEAGERREVRFQLGDTMYGGDAVGVQKEGYFGGYAVANSPNFIDDIANQQTMTINPDTDRALDIDLTGTKLALDALRACQAETAQ